MNYEFSPGGIGLREAGPISLLVSKAQAFADRLLVDMTGLQGTFEWQVAFSLQPNPPIDAELPSIATAFQEQLGLKLEPRTGPIEVLVIDHVEPPTPD